MAEDALIPTNIAGFTWEGNFHTMPGHFPEMPQTTMPRQPDQILISRLELSTRIGATEAERSQPQRVHATVVLEPITGFSELHDRLDRTVDYDAVAQAVKACAAQGERTLIETLAEEIAALLLRRFALAAVGVELRKFFLPDAEFTAVRIRRER